jgi:hypothetical protein
MTPVGMAWTSRGRPPPATRSAGRSPIWIRPPSRCYRLIRSRGGRRGTSRRCTRCRPSGPRTRSPTRRQPAVRRYRLPRGVRRHNVPPAVRLDRRLPARALVPASRRATRQPPPASSRRAAPANPRALAPPVIPAPSMFPRTAVLVRFNPTAVLVSFRRTVAPSVGRRLVHRRTAPVGVHPVPVGALAAHPVHSAHRHRHRHRPARPRPVTPVWRLLRRSAGRGVGHPTVVPDLGGQPGLSRRLAARGVTHRHLDTSNGPASRP